MVQVKIATRVKIKERWLDEVKALLPNYKFEIVTTDKQMAVWFHPQMQAYYGVFESVRQIVDSKTVRVRALVMSLEELKALGITNHLALYDNIDRDGVLDFYMGLPDRLDNRARNNGFKSNFAWLFVHEALHGMEQEQGRYYPGTDRVHDMEALGKLKELLEEHLFTIPTLTEMIKKLTSQLFSLLKAKQTKMIHPLRLPFRDTISQAYGVKNAIYTKTLVHIGTDYPCPIGTPLAAPEDGEILVSSKSPARGNYVQYKHGNYLLELRHLSKAMPIGQYKLGDIIAITGNTGMSSGPHVCVVVFKEKDQLPFINQSNWQQLTFDAHKLYI